MRDRYHWKRFFWLSLVTGLILISGSGQEVGISPSLGDNLSLDSGLVVPSALALPGEAGANTVAPALGPGVDYTSIQEAIENSDPGDVIYVQSGTYDEVVTVNKPGLSLTGVDSGDGMPVVSGDGVESTVTISSDGCTLEGFVVMNSGNPHAGVSVVSNGNTIIGNTIVDNRGYGIHLDGSRNNSIWGNNVSANGFSGISLQNSTFNNLTSNIARANNHSGIELVGSPQNAILENVASDDGEHGIRLFRSDKNVLRRNIARANNHSGIELVSSPQNAILENVASDDGEHGIRLFRSDKNVLRRNIASNNTLEGISVEDSLETVVEGNVVIDVKKVASPVEGTVVNFTIIVANTGQVDFEKVTVTDRLHAGLDYVSDNRSGNLEDGEICWTLDPLAANESAIIELSAQIKGSTFVNLANSVRVAGVTAGGVVVSQGASAVVSTPLVVGSNGNISNAIELARPGDMVLVESGTYHDCIVLDKNITLRGVDTGGGPPVIVGDGFRSTITLLADGCAIEGFEVTGSGNPHAGIEIVSNNNSISNNFIRGNKGYGVRIFEARDNSVTSNEIRENGFDGMSVEGSDENKVSDNLISVNGKSGIALDGSFGNLLSANTIASNGEQGIGLLDSGENSLQENDVRGNSGHGVQLIGSEMNSISRNVASYNKNDGVHLEGSNENDLSTNTAEGNKNGLQLINSRANTLSDNEANKNKEHGIRLRGSDKNTLSGNAFDENLLHGAHLIRSKNNTLDGNDAEKNRRDGIYIEESNGNEISANTITGNQNGLILKSSSENDISANEIKENGQNGIGLASSDQNAISGNTISDNSLRGIFLYSYSNKNTLSGNTANGNGIVGICLAQSSSNMLSENTATNNDERGIYLYSYSNKNTLSGNTATDNGLGIRLDSSNGNTIYKNAFENTKNAWSNSANAWHSPTKIEYMGSYTHVGNRWSDYSGWDCDGDGIGDWPYEIPGGSERDYYPLTDRTGTRTLTVCASGCYYTSIQAAINAACPGDTIEVHSGTYYENVIVDKQLTLRGVGDPVVDAGGSCSSITIAADMCTIEGFVATNSGDAWPCAGIYVTSNGNTISGNTAINNKWDGISIDNSRDNMISCNSLTGNSASGMYLRYSSSNTIVDNTANGNNGNGMLLSPSSNDNTIVCNTVSNNNYGIYLWSSNDNTIEGNTLVDNNQYGIVLGSTCNNTIYLNNLINNAPNAYSIDNDNHWNSTEPIAPYSTNVGNRWSDYSGWDCDGDGIGDWPYEIPGGSEKDCYPLTDRTGTRTLTVCASGCNFTSIQAAINAACPGDTIEVHSGTYNENVVVDKQLTLRGVGDPMVDAGGSGSAINITADGCILEGFVAKNSGGAWHCAGISVTSSGNTILDNTATGNGENGISIWASNGYNIIINNTIYENDHDGIEIAETGNNNISGNKIYGNSNNGINLLWSNWNTVNDNIFTDNHELGIILNPGNNNIISDNTATGNNCGIALYESDSNTISGNNANRNSYKGIHLSESSSNTISGNTASDNDGDGISLWSSSDNTILGNTATGNVWDGIHIESSNGNTITNNTASSNQVFGIELQWSSGNTIIINTATNNGGNVSEVSGSGILLSSSSENTLSSNTVNYNHIGIELNYSNNNTISDNTLNDNYAYGIYLDSSGGNTISGNSAYNSLTGVSLTSSSDNTLSDNTATNNDYSGINIEHSSSNTISGNTATGNVWYGIDIDFSSSNTISGNTASDNDGGGISLWSSSDNTILGNTANGNGHCGIDFSDSDDNSIYGNTANGNDLYGIRLDDSTGNTIYQNAFNNTNNSVSDFSPNHWNSTVPLEYTYNGFEHTNYTGNYWSDYSGNDSNGDGIGDTPYDIFGGSEKDYYPMISNVAPPMAAVAVALAPEILVDLSGDLVAGSPSGTMNLTLNATNPGPENLTSLGIVALIPEGMSYIPGRTSVEPDSVAESPNGTWTATWENLSDLGAGESVEIGFAAQIDGDLLADLTTIATASGLVDEGENVSLSEGGSEDVSKIASGSDTWTVYVQNSVNAKISVKKIADPPIAEPGDLVTFSINITNTGEVELTNLTVADLLPAGMSYVSAFRSPLVEPIEYPNGTVFLNWTGLTDLAPNESNVLDLVARVDGDATGPLTNTAFVAATFREEIAVGFVKDFDNATVQLRALNVTKVADKDEVKRGEEIAYNITVCNVGSLSIMDLVLEDVFDHQVEVVSESVSRGPDGRWRIDLLEPNGSISIILIVKVPRQEFEFEMASRAEGEGFVNVADDYSTTLDPFVIRNIVRAISANTTRQYSDSASVTVLGEPGTELETREHGSGSYESDEQVLVRTENKSISMDKDVAATYTPTAIGLYRNRTLNYSSRWTEEARAKNRITGTSLSESYRYATSIDRDSRFFLDENESVMEIESEFDGVGHIGFLKKDPKSSPGSVPLFESREDYTGSFRVLEKIDEYGSGIGSEKSASGEGLVLVDKRVGSSQRSYESGAGSYNSDELIRTETNYIAKDLSVASGEVETNLTDEFAVNSSMKWKEGMWSRVANTSFIGEEYTGASELDKETIARGLNDMDTLANFTGRARYRAVLEDETEVDFDDQYEGTYSIQRRILLEGVPSYDRPHLSLRKDGKMIYPATDTSPIASYTISIENDGDKTLGPVIVKDLLPPGSVFVNSSLRPSELTDGGATWTLTHLAIGDRFKIDLVLNLTGYRDDEIVNQVLAEGGYNGNWARAENFSAVEIDWLRCCPSGDIVTVEKTGRIDVNETNVVLYAITVENVGDGAAAAVVTDTLPDGMVLLEAEPEFASLDNGVVTWNLIDLMPGETRMITYRAQAQWSGKFVNRVRVDASLVDGSGSGSVYAGSVVEVGEFEGEVPAPGWQPPEWGFNYTGYAVDLTYEEICKLS